MRKKNPLHFLWKKTQQHRLLFCWQRQKSLETRRKKEKLNMFQLKKTLLAHKGRDKKGFALQESDGAAVTVPSLGLGLGTPGQAGDTRTGLGWHWECPRLCGGTGSVPGCVLTLPCHPCLLPGLGKGTWNCYLHLELDCKHSWLAGAAGARAEVALAGAGMALRGGLWVVASVPPLPTGAEGILSRASSPAHRWVSPEHLQSVSLWCAGTARSCCQAQPLPDRSVLVQKQNYLD